MLRTVWMLLGIVFSIAVAYAIILVLMYLLQSQMIYHPQSNIFATPTEIGLEYEDVQFQADDENQLHGWFVPSNTSDLTVLYFHGNAGNISGRMETIKMLHRLGLNIFIFDYRGYGRSEGNPTEEGTYSDAIGAWNYLVADRGISPENILPMGRSLGGAVAVWLAAHKNPGGAIIESTFTSAAELGGDIYPWLPVRLLLRYEYNTLENISRINTPLFMAHSRDDQIVPFHHGEKLFEAAKNPKTFVELRGSHGSGFWETGAKYQDALQQFLENEIKYK